MPPLIRWPKLAKRLSKDFAPQTPEEREVIEMVNDRRQEADDFRNRGSGGVTRAGQRAVGLSIETQWELSGNRFLGNHWHTANFSNDLIEGYQAYKSGDDLEGNKGVRRFTLNRTQNSIISNTSGMLRELPEITFQPVETDDNNEYMMSIMGGATLADLVNAAKMKADVLAQLEQQRHQANVSAEAPAGQAGMVEQQMQQAQLDESETMILEADFTPGQLGMDENGAQIPSGPREMLTESQAGVVERLVKDGLLREEDLIEIDDRTTEEVLSKVFRTIWKRSNSDHHVLMNELYCNIFGHQPLRFQFDWQRGRFDLENLHILNVWIDPGKDSIDKADYLIFDYAVDLDQAKSQWPHLEETLEKAKETGIIESRHAGRRQGASGRDTDYQRPMVQVRTAYLRHQKVDMTEQEAIESGDVLEVDVLVAAGDERAVELEGFKYAIDQDGELVRTVPGDENWPKGIGVREIKILPQVDRKVVDRRCPYWDIPFGWNVNIPIPYTPYGQGEPIRLDDVQHQINLVMTILSNHIRYYQWPMRYWPRSVFSKLKRMGFSLHSRPGMEVPIDDMKWMMMQKAGGASMSEPVPSIPPQYVNILQLYLAEHDRLSGNVDVRQGVSPGDRISGAAVDSLRTEALGPLAFKSRFTEQMLERIGYLAVQAMVDYYPPVEWRKICSNYPIGAMKRIVDRAAHNEWNITVQVVTGRGANRTHEKEEAMGEYSQGLRSKESTMRELGVDDPKEERRKMMEEQAEEAQAQASVQAASVDSLGQVQPTGGSA